MIKKILVSQPKPKDKEKSPYFQLAEKRRIQVDYQPFINIKAISKEEFINQKIELEDYQSIIFTNTNAINSFFNMVKMVRHSLSDKVNYFCQTKMLANYLTKYVSFRKRRVHYTERGDFRTIEETFHKYQDHRFLFPSSTMSVEDSTSKLLDAMEVNFDKVILYKTVCNSLSNIADIRNYDMLVLLCPSSIKSLVDNFPDFKNHNIKLAAFGTSTVNTVKELGLKCDVGVDKVPSIVKAIDNYIECVNSEGKQGNK